MSAQRLAIAAASRAGGARPRARRTSDLPVRGPTGISIARADDHPGGGVNGTPTARQGPSTGHQAVNGASAAVAAESTIAQVAGRDGSHSIRRSTTTTTTAPSPTEAGTTGTNGTNRDNGNNSNGHNATRPGGSTGLPSTTEVLDRVDEMMTHLEERILEELERRGGRFTGTF